MTLVQSVPLRNVIRVSVVLGIVFFGMHYQSAQIQKEYLYGLRSIGVSYRYDFEVYENKANHSTSTQTKLTEFPGIDFFSSVTHLEYKTGLGPHNDFFQDSLKCFDRLKVLRSPLPSDLSFLENMTQLEHLSALNGQNRVRSYQLRNLISLKTLDLGSFTFAEVTFLSKLKNLEELQLGIHGDIDITPLSKLPKLKKLTISFYQDPENSEKLVDLSPLKDSPSLEILFVISERNPVIEKLSDHPTLKRIDLWVQHWRSDSSTVIVPSVRAIQIAGNETANLSSLSAFPNLKYLEQSDTQVTDFRFLNHLPKLESFRTPFNSNSILTDEYLIPKLDLTALPTNNKLSQLDISRTRKFIAQKTTEDSPLKELAIDDCENIDLSGLSQSRKIESVQLTGIKNVSLVGLENKLDLKSFFSNGCGLKSMKQLEASTKLKELRLFGEQKLDFSSIPDFPNLSILDLDSSKIHNLEILKRKSKLSTLSIRKTPIEDISPLLNCQQLRELDLSGTKIKDFSILKKLHNLESLDLSSTEFSDLSLIEHLSKLKFLNIRNTKITDFSPIKKLQNLQKIDVDELLDFDFQVLAHLQNPPEMIVRFQTNHQDSFYSYTTYEYLDAIVRFKRCTLQRRFAIASWLGDRYHIIPFRIKRKIKRTLSRFPKLKITWVGGNGSRIRISSLEDLKSIYKH